MKKRLAALALALATMTINAGNAMAATPAEIQRKIETTVAASGGTIFPLGSPNTANAAHFTGESYVAWLSKGGVPIGNVTFVDGAHTYWHVHHGSCQVLVAESGRGYYQIWGEAPHELLPGMTVTIPAGTKHWHGAAPGSMFQHISIMESVPKITTEWLEEVNPADYRALKP